MKKTELRLLKCRLQATKHSTIQALKSRNKTEKGAADMKTLQSKIKEKANSKDKIKGFYVLENECIWMKAGIVNFRLCSNVYDCNHCPFDKGMRRAMKTAAETPEKKEINRLG